MKELILKLNWVDYIALAAVLRGCYVGYKGGLFPEFLRIVAYSATVLLSLHFYEVAAQFLTLQTFLNIATSRIFAFLGIFLAAFFLTKLIRMIVIRMLKVGEGGFFYRLMGSVLAMGRWVFFLSLLFVLIDRSPLTGLKEDIQTRSLTGTRIAQVAPTAYDYLSKAVPQLALPKADA